MWTMILLYVLFYIGSFVLVTYFFNDTDMIGNMSMALGLTSVLIAYTWR